MPILGEQVGCYNVWLPAVQYGTQMDFFLALCKKKIQQLDENDIINCCCILKST